MDPERIRAGTRRRVVGAGVAIGVVVGAVTGAALFTGAAPRASGPRPLVLHAAPALVVAERTAELSAATFCEQPDAPSCAVVQMVGLVQPAGVAGWSQIVGELREGAYRVSVPAELVPADGFSYRLEFRTRDGAVTSYPPGGDGGIRVLTTAGLPVRQLPAFQWRPRQADGVAVAMRYGDADGEVGRWTGSDEEVVVGPSSFDVTPDGSVFVADWVHRRIQVFSDAGRFERSLAMPTDVPVDLAVSAGGGLALTTLGSSATAFELDEHGGVVGRYPVGFGVASRVVATSAGPLVSVGPGQWTPVRSRPGTPLDAPAQGRLQTASAPLASGEVGVSADIAEGAFAAVWTRPDGSRGGTSVQLPPGVVGGTDYFVQPTPDGGALVAKGVWDETHFGVGLFRFDATGAIAGFDLLPEPSTEQAARYSTVRFRAPGDVLVAIADDLGVHIDRFEVR
jgi:hypothetical protein